MVESMGYRGETQLLPMPGFDRLAVAKIDFDQLLAGRNAGDHLLRLTVDHSSAVRIDIAAVNAERDPPGMGLLGRVFEKRYVGHMLRRHHGDVVYINVAVNPVHHPDLFLIGPDVDSVTHRAVRFVRRRIRYLRE